MSRAYRVWSAVLERDIWIAESEEEAREVEREDETNVVFTLEEARLLAVLPDELADPIGCVKLVFAGSVLRKIGGD